MSELFEKPITDRQYRELHGLADLPGAWIDASSAPEAKVRPTALEVGRSYREMAANPQGR